MLRKIFEGKLTQLTTFEFENMLGYLDRKVGVEVGKLNKLTFPGVVHQNLKSEIKLFVYDITYAMFATPKQTIY